ncbi:MAG: hypothetical protein IIC91_10555 [Chloroflexi bacterium]|nr:hypothetical protein [Chloroflexota bacterium]
MSAAFLIAFLVLLTMACSSSSPTLQLRTGPITEDEFRTQILQTAFAQPSGVDFICTAASGLLPEELLDAYDQVNLFVGESPPSAPSAEQSAKAADILIEQCEDLT